MFLSLLLSLLFVFVPGENEVRYDTPTLKQITTTLYGVALVGLVSAYFIRKFMLRQASNKPIDIENEKTSAQISPYIARYMPAVTVSLAIAESIAAFGLTIFFMSRDLKTFVTFLALSALGLFLHRPKFEEAKQLAISIKQS